MGARNYLQSTLFVVVAVVISLQIVDSVPVSIDTNGRALRSVSLRRNSWDGPPVTNLLLSQQPQQPKRANSTVEPIFARRDNKTGGGDDITTITSTSGDGSIGEELGSGDGVNANGTLSNGTQASSRLRQNETEPCSLEPNILCSSDPPQSNRDKQRRIAHIVNYLWTNLFGNRTRPFNKEMVRDRLTPVNPSSSSFSGDLESIAASCDLPPAVESEAWSSERYLNLYFNLTSKYPDIFGLNGNVEDSVSEQQQQDEQSNQEESGQDGFLAAAGTRPGFTTISVAARSKSVNILSAKLRLYKIGLAERNNVPAFADIVPSEPCNDTEPTIGTDEVVPRDLPTTATFPEFATRTDEKIRVSVFWYTQPATKNHYKKKLLDAKMLSLGESQWVEFDIKNAVAAWLNDRKPNYGIVVEVENENQDALDTKKYFSSAPCYKASSVGSEQFPDENQAGSGSGSNGQAGEKISISTSPTIEICTLNVPETTTNFEQGKVFPYSININSLNHLQRVADSHAKSNRDGTSQTWQNINLRGLSPDDFGIVAPNGNGRSSNTQQKPTTTVVFPSHRHRHHHELSSQNENINTDSGSSSENQQRGKSRVSHPRVILDEDHPLREILATVNGNSKEYNKRGSASIPGLHSFGKGFHRNSDMPADEGRLGSDYLDSTEHDRDVFITKIVITPAQLKENARRGIFPFPTSMSALTSTTNPGSSSDSDR